MRAANFQKQQELWSYEIALTNASTGADKLSSTNNLLQDTLAKAYKSHDEALAAKDKYYAEEFAREKAHVETLARQKMNVEIRKAVVATNGEMAEKYATARVVLQQRRDEALAKMDEEHTEALATKDKHHREALTKEKAEAQEAGRREAINRCKQWHRSGVQAAERRHIEALAHAIWERDTMHEDTLAKKEKESKEVLQKVKDRHIEYHKQVRRFYDGSIKVKKDEHARRIAEKDQELADMKARLGRYPELWLAEDDVEDSEEEDYDGDDEDEDYGSIIDGGEAEPVDHEDAEPQDSDKAESSDDEDAESQIDVNREDEEPREVEYDESDVEFNVEGDDSEDELRQWAVIDSDVE